jgi:uncharacterized sulfatase
MERDRRLHLAMVAAVDDAAGALLTQLDNRGLARDTVVCFLSDNGATREERASSLAQPNTGGSNGRYRGYKLGLFDGGIRVPAILRVPGAVKPGTVWERPAMTMDLLPTLLSLAAPGAPPPAGIDGQNLLPILRGERPGRETHFWSHGAGRAVRHGDWKLLLNPPLFPGEPVNEKVWLSNLEADPEERVNLADKEPARAADLAARIRAWEKDVNPPAR